MTHQIIRLTALLLALALLPALPAAAQPDSGFSGSFLVGLRSVDVGGADRKFKEDINLDDGPRLFDLSFQFIPAEDAQRTFADVVRFDLDNLGGDPFETLNLNIEKFGSYDFEYSRYVSDYFYEDIILPPDLASITGSTGGDFHHFDFQRTRDRARLDIDVNSRATVHFGFDHFTKEGESTTTLDMNRDEFELDKPIDETLNDWFAGFDYSWDNVTLMLQHQVRDYENLVEIFLPGFSTGENVPDPSTLSFFFLDQPYELDSNETSARLLFQPTERFEVRLHAAVQDLESEIEASERSAGTNFSGNPFTTNVTGNGIIDRDMEHFGVELSYLISDRVQATLEVRQNELDQTGALLFGADANVGDWNIDTTGAELGVELFVNPQVTLSGGVSWEDREVDFGFDQDGTIDDLEGEDTERNGWFAIATWRPSSRFLLTVDLEDNSFDDPFTLVSPTDRQRYGLRARYRLANGIFANLSYRNTEYENDNSGWDAETEQTQLRFAWERDQWSAALGYSLVDVTRQIDQIVLGGARAELFNIFYEADSDFLDGRVAYDFNDRLTAGVRFLLYENDGSFGLERDDWRAFVDWALGSGYLAHLAYRTVDYDEERFSFDDYDADIIEIGIGYRF